MMSPCRNPLCRAQRRHLWYAAADVSLPPLPRAAPRPTHRSQPQPRLQAPRQQNPLSRAQRRHRCTRCHHRQNRHLLAARMRRQRVPQCRTQRPHHLVRPEATPVYSPKYSPPALPKQSPEKTLSQSSAVHALQPLELTVTDRQNVFFFSLFFFSTTLQGEVNP
jgi:hypothetical protein